MRMTYLSLSLYSSLPQSSEYFKVPLVVSHYHFHFSAICSKMKTPLSSAFQFNKTCFCFAVRVSSVRRGFNVITKTFLPARSLLPHKRAWRWIYHRIPDKCRWTGVKGQLELKQAIKWKNAQYCHVYRSASQLLCVCCGVCCCFTAK